MTGFERARSSMVQTQLVPRGIADKRVLAAFRTVPREAFVPGELVGEAFDDGPLPLIEGQTISQPYIVAVTAEALQLAGQERVLEVGTGSGYAAAILGALAREVYTVERLPSLASSAAARLRRLGFDNVEVRCGDGTLGWPEHAPYDAVAVAAGGPKVPPALLEQLAVGGRLVMPVGPAASQTLVRVTRDGLHEFRTEPLMPVRFVPLIGEAGVSMEKRASASA